MLDWILNTLLVLESNFIKAARLRSPKLDPIKIPYKDFPVPFPKW